MTEHPLSIANSNQDTHKSLRAVGTTAAIEALANVKTGVSRTNLVKVSKDKLR